MAIFLRKGQKVNLTKDNPGLSKILVGLGWDVNYKGNYEFDLDAEAFMLGANERVPSDAEFIFYFNLGHASGSIQHMGDNRTGAGEGDDEQIKIDLSKVPANIQKIVFTVTIYDAYKRKQNFGQVSNAFIRIVDEIKDEEIIRYNLDKEFSNEISVIVGELYRSDSEWKFNAIGSGFQGDLRDLCLKFGVNV